MSYYDEYRRLMLDQSVFLFILVRLWNHAQIRSWNQPVLGNEGKVSCSRKQGDALSVVQIQAW